MARGQSEAGIQTGFVETTTQARYQFACFRLKRRCSIMGEACHSFAEDSDLDFRACFFLIDIDR